MQQYQEKTKGSGFGFFPEGAHELELMGAFLLPSSFAQA